MRKEVCSLNYDKKIADLERKIENQQKEIEIFRKAFAELGVMLREEKSLFYGEKTLEENIPLAEICDKKSDEGNDATDDCDKIICDRKKFFRLPTKTEIWAFYAGIWAVLTGFWLLDRLLG